MDTPPRKWFERPLTRGPLRGARLDPLKYDRLLGDYYGLMGWDYRGVPRRSTLERLGLGFAAEELDARVGLLP